MKKPLFKVISFLSVSALVFFIAFSCTKQAATPELKTKDLAKTAVSLSGDNPFKRTVGAPIPAATSKRWVENYNRLHHTTTTTLYGLQRKDLESILSAPACVGLMMYYATDEKGENHILPIGVNENGKRMQTALINTSRGPVNWDIAQQWIAKYNGEIKSRFFGAETFGRLFSKPSCTAVWALFATDDEGDSQLVLSRKYEGDITPSYVEVEDEDDSLPCGKNCL